MSRDALVVGINTYRYEPLNNLKGVPAKDAEAIAQRLSQSNNFLVRRLPEFLDPLEGNIPRIAANKEVTKSELENAILRLFLPDGERIPQTALFYFSGHGLRYKKGISEGFLATTDVNPDEDRWGISLKWLREILKKSKNPQQVVWLDCCYASEFINYEEASSRVGDRCFIAAAREFEESWQDVNSDYSVLTRVLVEGLDPKHQPDGLVDNYRLMAFISQTLKNAQQRQVFYNSGEAIVLVQSSSLSTPNTGNTFQPEICPYRGLEAFDLRDVQFFHGRTALTDELLEAIWQQNFLAILGPSGSGKSSVVKAGLLYSISEGKRRDTKAWHVLPVIKPGEHPLESLAAAFVNPAEPVGRRVRSSQTYADSFRERGSAALAELIEEYAPNPVVLVIDQFEELFTLCQEPQERQQFCECLMSVSETHDLKEDLEGASLLRLVITLRADFLGKVLEQEYAGFAHRLKSSIVSITPLNRNELQAAIVQSAEQVGLQVEQALVQQMIADVQSAPGSLPLLQYALTELWERWHEQWKQDPARAGNQLTLTDYHQIGGVQGALEQHANKVYDALSKTEQPIAQRIFLELTQLGEGTEDTRRRVLKQELINDQHPELLLDQVISQLVKSRLLVTDELRDTTDTHSQVILDVAHEALIRHWPRLRQWLDDDRDTLRTERKLKAAAKEWQEKSNDPAYLWFGARLEEAEDYAQQYTKMGRLDIRTEQFIHVSRTEQNRQEQEKDHQIQELNRALTEATLREQAERVLNLLIARQPKAGLELAVQAIGVNREKFPDRLLSTVQGSLNQAMNLTRVSNKLEGHSDYVLSVAFSPDGRTIVSGSWDHTIRLWDLAGKPMGEPFQGHTDAVLSVAFSPDGKTIVSGSVDQTIRRWDLAGNPIGQPFQGHADAVGSVAFSPDGKTIVSGSDDRTIRRWALAGNPIGQPFQGHSSSVSSVAFSPDGKTIVSGSWDKTIRLWDLAGNPIGQPFQGHSDYVWSVAFSPDGKTIVSGSNDHTIRLWDLAGKPIGRPFEGHSASILSVAFSSDGRTIVSGSWDHTIRLWDLAGKPMGEPFQGHTDAVLSVVFSPDDKTIVSGSWDQKIRLWDLAGNLMGEPFRGHSSPVYSVAFSPDDKTIVSGSWDQKIRLWDLAGNPIGQPFQGHTDAVLSIAFSPDGTKIVSGSYDQTIRLWDLAGNPIGQPFQGHSFYVSSVAFSPDGTKIVSGSLDHTIRLWDLAGNPIGQPFRGHSASVLSVAFSPDGTKIVSGSVDQTIRLWDLAGNPIGQPFQGHSDHVRSVAFSPDGMKIVTGSYDQTIRLWDLAGNPIGQPFQGHSDHVRSVAFSPDGMKIVSGSDDHTIRLWRGNWQGWLGICCRRLGYYLVSDDSELEITTDDPGAILRSEDTAITTTQKACAACQKYVWNDETGRKELARILRRQGNDLARQGKIELAEAKFRQASERDPTIALDPKVEGGKFLPE